jgi:hypothetical protein
VKKYKITLYLLDDLLKEYNHCTDVQVSQSVGAISIYCLTFKNSSGKEIKTNLEYIVEEE